MNEPAPPVATGRTAQRAAGSSFYTAMRVLPRAQRDAMFEIYTFCRAVDDVADDPGPRGERLFQLERWREGVKALYAGKPPPHLSGLARHVQTYGLDRDDMLAIIDGMEMDVISDIRAPHIHMLDIYCDRVASAVGRLSVKVFGMAPPDGASLAHHLGRALQLTNILRDLDEDAAMGRLYLPRETLRAAGIASTHPAVVLSDPAIGEACAPVVALARTYFQEADKIMARSPRKVVRAPRIMSKAYRLILNALARRGWKPPRRKVSISRARLLWIVMRHGAF